MKQIFGLIVLLVILIGFGSCRKEYTCGCTFSDSSKNFDKKIENALRNEAYVICEDYSTFVGNCKLK
jgi:hypothetical protein